MRTLIPVSAIVSTLIALYLIFMLYGTGKNLPILNANLDIEYSFFVAGHTYGKPGTDRTGLYPPLMSKLNELKSISNLKFGVLTGDVVVEGSVKNWNEIDDDIEQLDIPIFIAAGNHDLTNRKLFKERYGPTYFNFEVSDDVFIILDGNADNWSIKGKQLEFLTTTLKKEYANVFLFVHQVIWWDEQNSFSIITPNSFYGRISPTNYWSEIEPKLRDVKSSVYLFAGDVGAFEVNDLPSYFNYANVHYITSGMGGGRNDNFLIVTRGLDGKVEIDVIFLDTSFSIKGLKSRIKYTLFNLYNAFTFRNKTHWLKK